jgi:ABC-type phosphate/phosphonate transport system substrate-binding protein
MGGPPLKTASSVKWDRPAVAADYLSRVQTFPVSEDCMASIEEFLGEYNKLKIARRERCNKMELESMAISYKDHFQIRLRCRFSFLLKYILAGLISVLALLQHPTDLFAEIANLPKVVRMGFSSRVFPDVDQRDAQVAMELWTRELARSMGIRTSLQTVIFNKPAELLNAVKRGELIVVVLPAIEYLQIRDKTLLSPSIVAANYAGNSRQFLLIVRRDSGIRSVADLRGKSILLPSSTKHEASHIWLDVLLMRDGKSDRINFFRQIKESTTSSQSIMGIFFKQADAAIVSRGALETSRALNSQVGSQLLIISESKSFLGDLTCIPSSVGENLRHSIENASLHLHETTVGKQIFTLFQIDRTIPFQPSYLEGLIELLRERDRLMAKRGKRR